MVFYCWLPYRLVQQKLFICNFIIRKFRLTGKLTNVKFTLNRRWTPRGGVEVYLFSFFLLRTRMGPVWTSAENLTATGIRPPGCPASSELLYWLSYPGPLVMCSCSYKCRRYVEMQRGIMLQFHPTPSSFQYPPSIHALICITPYLQIKLQPNP